jgi:subtilase family serine protease
MKKILFVFALAITTLFAANITQAADLDLRISADNITITPTVLKEGLTATFKAKIENKSAVNASNVKVHFFVDNKLAGEKNISSIVKKYYYFATQTYVIPAGAAGEHRLTVVIGDGKPSNISVLPLIIQEVKEDKTQAEKKFTILPSVPDLSIVPAGLSVTPATFKGGDKINFKAIVRNIGLDPAKNFKVALYLNDVKISESVVAVLAKNSQTTIYKQQYQLPANASGNQIFKAVIDEANTIAESNEKNNVAEKTLSIAKAQRDLFFELIKPNPVNPTAGQPVTWQLKIKNVGNSPATNFRINFYTDNSDTYSEAYQIPSLAPGATLVKSPKWTVPANISTAVGYTVRATVDAFNAVDETNENNNTILYSLNLKAPDLKIEAGEGTYQSGKIYPGIYLTQTAKISNNNVMPVNNVKVGLYYSLNNETTLTKLAEQNIGTLAKNGSYKLNLYGAQPANKPLGTVYHVIMKVDNNNAVAETNEDNNSLEIIKTLTEKPRQVTYPYLRVTVADENWNPLNGATVKLTNTATNAVETKITGSETFYTSTGNVIFESRPNTANYKVEVSYAGYRTAVDTIAYDKDSDNTQEKQIYLDKKALVSGVVKNNAGAVLPWAVVRVEGLGLEATTDAQGKYGFLLNGGTYNLRFSREGYTRVVVSNYAVAPLSNQTLNEILSPGTVGYVSGRVTDDEGNGLANTDVLVNDTMLGVTGSDGHFSFNVTAGNGKKFTFRKKPTYVNTEFTDDIIAGKEYNYDLVMYKPSTDNHVERGANIISWHQHEGTPANSFFIPEYNIDVWWGMGRVKMGLDYNKSGSQTKISKLTINVKGEKWECNKVEGDGDVETSAIDIPITISAGSCSNILTQVDVYKVAIESGGAEIWSDPGFWTSASDPMNTKTKVFTFSNQPVVWDGNFKVKAWVRMQKKAVVGTDGDGSGALSGYYMDKKMVTWYPQKPPTTKVSTSWKQVGGYFLGILSNPVNAVTGFTDMFTAEEFNQYDMADVLPQNFPGYISD